LAEGLLKDPGFGQLSFEDAYALLLLKAKAEGAGRPQLGVEAIESYLLLCDLVKKDRGKKIPPKEFQEKVLAPAIEKADPNLKKDVAKLYDAQGRLIEENLAGWPSNKAAEQAAFDSFHRASELDPSEAKYVVREVSARMKLPEPNLEELRQ